MTIPEPDNKVIAESEVASKAAQGNDAGTEVAEQFQPTAESQSLLLVAMPGDSEAEGQAEAVESAIGGLPKVGAVMHTTSTESNNEEDSPWAERDAVSGSAEPEAWPEAGPNWILAKLEWEEAWPFHVYFFALAHIAICIMALYIMVTALTQKGPRSSMNKTTIALSLMILSFAATRAVFLFVDPYYSTQALPFVVARLLWSVGIPGFTASFSIMLLILLDTTKMSLAPPRFQNVRTVGLIWFVHLLIVLTTDVLVIYIECDVRPLLIVCQMLFVLYGMLVSVGYAYVGFKMKKNMKASSSSGVHEDQESRVRRLLTMTYLSSVAALSVAVINIYTAVGQFGPYAGVPFVNPWPYWGVQTCSRFLEVFATSLVLMLFFRSSKGGSSKDICNQCCDWRKTNFVQPETISGSVTSSIIAVTGLMWRHRKETEPNVKR